ncbi:MAG: rhodanese-like domain-containing protein [Bacteroidota bacterium]
MEITTLARYKKSIREALIIILAATTLGFAYTIVMKKGLFTPPPPIAPLPTVAAPVFVSYEEAVAMFNEGNTLFVDARHEFDYKLGHIQGAINVPLKDFTLQTSPLANIPKDKLIVTYCDGAECNSSIELAKKLSEAGFTNVRMFFGGWNEWQLHHQQTEH